MSSAERGTISTDYGPGYVHHIIPPSLNITSDGTSLEGIQVMFAFPRETMYVQDPSGTHTKNGV